MDRKEMKEMEQRVDIILENNYEARDNDHVLIAEIWRQDLHALTGCKPNSISFDEMGNPKLTRFATVERARRTIQNEYHRWESTEQCADRKQELEREYPPALGYPPPILNCFGQVVVSKQAPVVVQESLF